MKPDEDDKLSDKKIISRDAEISKVLKDLKWEPKRALTVNVEELNGMSNKL
jgi:hypothetical protein